MIAVLNSEGELVRRLVLTTTTEFSLHPVYGLIESSQLSQRIYLLKKRMIKKDHTASLFSFKVFKKDNGWAAQPSKNCQAAEIEPGVWCVEGRGHYLTLKNHQAILPTVSIAHQSRDSIKAVLAIAAFLLFATLFVLYNPSTEAPLLKPEPEQEPVTVHVPKIDKVKLPTQPLLPSVVQNTKKLGGTAVPRELGFLGVLGKKDLSKILGGMPTAAPIVTAGAGQGGNAGSGGELLTGLGKGVRQITVGNSGAQGLGGVGKQGAGGGAGGYGDSWIGSGGTGNGLNAAGEGRRLSQIQLSQTVELDGGLDKNVILATIEKYINQIRYCYEKVLQNKPGLEGQVAVQFNILGDGLVQLPRVMRTTLNNQEVESCMLGKIQTWIFPQPRGGKTVKVDYPFSLRPLKG